MDKITDVFFYKEKFMQDHETLEKKLTKLGNDQAYWEYIRRREVNAGNGNSTLATRATKEIAALDTSIQQTLREIRQCEKDLRLCI